MIRIAHIITDTDTGGAELMLAKLVRNMDAGRYHNDILSLLPVDNVGHGLQRDGFSVESADMRPGIPTPAAFGRIVRWLKARRPALVQTWMYHSDLLGGMAGRYFARMPVVWNIRQSNLDREVNSSSTMHAARICRGLSRRLPAAIVCGSEAAKRTHSEFGYSTERMEVIPNGFDTDLFRPDPEAKARLCVELKIPGNALIVGMAARLDPQKDHFTFMRAARVLYDRLDSERRTAADMVSVGETGPAHAMVEAAAVRPVYFVLCGENIEWGNRELREWIGEGPNGPFGSRLRLTGRRHDLHAVYPAFDVSGTSSLGEGFPNVVGEAMACGVPCVVTDAGDSARIVGDTGFVVPPRDPEALATAWEKLLVMDEEQRKDFGRQARERIRNRYGMKAVAGRYGELYSQVFRSFYGDEE